VYCDSIIYVVSLSYQCVVESDLVYARRHQLHDPVLYFCSTLHTAREFVIENLSDSDHSTVYHLLFHKILRLLLFLLALIPLACISFVALLICG
jgi:hypothetical protein